MHKKLSTNFFLIILTSLFVGCQSPHKNSPPSQKGDQKASWKAKMHEMSSNLRVLAPYIYSEKSFSDAKNKEVIEKNLTEFSKNLKTFKNLHKESLPDDDPSLLVTLDRLKSDVEQAHRSFLSQDQSFARANLRGVTQYCFFCHTRRAQGLSLKWPTNETLPGASAIETGDYLVATRQFEKAKSVFKKIIFSEESFFSFTKEKALKKLLLVDLRLNDDIEDALKTITKYQETPNVPAFMSELLDSWRKDLLAWKAKRIKTPKTLAEIDALIKKAEARKGFSYDEKANILYIIASKSLHDLLAQKQNRSERAKTYYLLGKSYEVLRGTGLWSLNEIYFESCIRKLSHSTLALSCYHELEDSIIVGYSGSGGYFVPYPVRKRLEELRELAEPLKAL